MTLRRRWFVITVAIGILAAIAAGEASFLIIKFGMDSLPDLAARGVSTTGHVLQPLPDQHNQVVYTYVANGSSYQAQNSSGAPNPPASQLRPGDELYVTYDPQKPQVSCACDPKPIMSGARYAWIPVVTMAGTAFVLTLVLGLGLTYAQTRRGITN